LDAVAFVFDLWEGQVDFGDDTGYVEAADVANAALILGLEVGADLGETAVVIVADGDGASGDGDSEDGSQNGNG